MFWSHFHYPFHVDWNLDDFISFHFIHIHLVCSSFANLPAFIFIENLKLYFFDTILIDKVCFTSWSNIAVYPSLNNSIDLCLLASIFSSLSSFATLTGEDFRLKKLKLETWMERLGAPPLYPAGVTWIRI